MDTMCPVRFHTSIRILAKKGEDAMNCVVTNLVQALSLPSMRTYTKITPLASNNKKKMFYNFIQILLYYGDIDA